jgi:hypothetical protein
VIRRSTGAPSAGRDLDGEGLLTAGEHARWAKARRDAEQKNGDDQ